MPIEEGPDQNMVKLIWALLCERLITDSETNSVTYVDAVESVTAKQLPANLRPLSLCTLWKGESQEDELVVGLHIVSPTGKEILSYQTPPSMFKDVTRNRVNFDLGGLPIEEVGEHTFVIERLAGDEWIEEAELPLEVDLREEESSEKSAESKQAT